MANYKEIVTKAVVGKAKKTSIDSFTVETNEIPNTVLGCWIINNTFNGVNNNGEVYINGGYDINVWYSYDNDTKTGVSTKTYNYSDKINVNLKEKSQNNEIIVRSLKQPTVNDVKIENNIVKVTVEKELAVEVVGDTKIRVSIEDMEDDYDIVDDNDLTDEVIEQIDEEYLK
ncbi:MAG: outer spore coat protein CotE [Firmicutes bacterium]|nr:outer spore coat protein CotE [Bacillota bacterium]